MKENWSRPHLTPFKVIFKVIWGHLTHFLDNLGMPHIKTTVWTRAFIWNHFRVSQTKNQASRAKKVPTTTSLRSHYDLMFFSKEKGCGAHQNDRMDESVHMNPFWGHSDQKWGRQSQKGANYDLIMTSKAPNHGSELWVIWPNSVFDHFIGNC